MIAVFVVKSRFPIFDEASYKMKRLQMYEDLSNKFQHMYCRDVERRLLDIVIFCIYTLLYKIDKTLNIKLNKINLDAKMRQGSRSPSRY